MAEKSSEAKARENIDRLLAQSGWIVQDKSQVNLSASQGIAVRELGFKRDDGRADYTLYVNRQPVGVIEAKREGTLLSGVAEQSGAYGRNLAEAYNHPSGLPFLYESTG